MCKGWWWIIVWIKCHFDTNLLEIILDFQLHSLSGVSVIFLVCYKYAYSQARVDALIQTFHFYTLGTTAKQTDTQNLWNVMRSYIPGVIPSICIASFQYVGSANTWKIYSVRCSQDMSTEWCKKKFVPIKVSHFTVGNVPSSSRWKPSWMTYPQIICLLESTARGNLVCVILHWQKDCRKWNKVS